MPLEAAVADLAVGVELGPGRHVDLDDHRAVVLDAALLGDRAALQPPRAPHEPDAGAGRQHRDVEHAVLGIGGADARATAERACRGDDHLPRVAVEDRPPSARTAQRSGAAVAAARSAPTA